MKHSQFSAQRADIREIHERRDAFMRLHGHAHTITSYIARKNLTPGSNWRGCSKGHMADLYAANSLRSSEGGSRLSEDVFQKLLAEFGQRPKKAKA